MKEVKDGKPKPMTADNNLHELVLQIIDNNMRKDACILDMGAGQGALTYQLLNRGYHDVTAADVTTEYWKMPHRDLTIVDFNYDFQQHFTKKFKLICAIEIIEHVENPIHFLRQCHRLLEPDGFLILSTPNVESFSSRMIFLWNGRLRFFSDEEISNHHITPIFGWYLHQAFQRIGFIDKQVYYTHDKVEISNSFKAKIFGLIIAPFRFLLRGDFKGENRIHFISKGKYVDPKAK